MFSETDVLNARVLIVVDQQANILSLRGAGYATGHSSAVRPLYAGCI